MVGGQKCGGGLEILLPSSRATHTSRVPIKSFFPSKKFSLHSFHKLENCWLGKAASVVSTPPKGPPSMITTFFTSIHVRSSLIRVFPTTTAIFFKIPPKVVPFFTIRTALFTRTMPANIRSTFCVGSLYNSLRTGAQ